MIINCDTHGFGDIMTLAWIAEGAKCQEVIIDFYATGNKEKLLKILNQNITDNKQSAISLNTLFAHDQHFIKKKKYTRIKSWLKFFDINHIQIKKPKYKLTQPAIEYANNLCDNNTIVLCPESIRPNREWPNCNWIELYDMFVKSGYKVLIVCYRGLSFNHLDGYVNNLSWDKIFAIFEKSKLVIGCDSAPIHAAGITNTKSIALLGPTTYHVFQHLKNVTPINISKEEMSCVGCWFYEEFSQDPCEFGCVALCSITPEDIYKKSIEIINDK